MTNAGRAELVTVAMPRLADLLANAQRDVQALLLLDGGEDLLNFGANGVAAAAVALNDLAREGRRRGVRVFIATAPPTIAGCQRSIPDAAIRAFNDQVGSSRAVKARCWSTCTPRSRRIPAATSGADGWHPNETGYRRIARRVPGANRRRARAPLLLAGVAF